MSDLVYRLRKRAEIRRNIPNRKSVQEGASDRIADLLDEAADNIEKLEAELFDKLEHERERSRGLVSALEYIIEHERYHGINQGRDSEDVAREVLAAYYASAKTEGSSSLLNSFSNEKLNKILGVDWFDDESAKEGEKDE